VPAPLAVAHEHRLGNLRVLAIGSPRWTARRTQPACAHKYSRRRRNKVELIERLMVLVPCAPADISAVR